MKDADIRKIKFLRLVYQSQGIIYSDIRGNLGMGGPAYNNIIDFWKSIGAITIKQDEAGLKIKKHFVTELGMKILLNLGEISEKDFKQWMDKNTPTKKTQTPTSPIVKKSKDKTLDFQYPEPDGLYQIISVINEVKRVITEKVKESPVAKAIGDSMVSMYPYLSIQQPKIGIFADKYSEHFQKKNYKKMKFYLGLFHEELKKDEMVTCLKHDSDARETYRKICASLGYAYDL